MKKFNTISRRTGTEGPRHDPYSYTEITVHGRNGDTTIHCGLMEWVKNNGKTLDSMNIGLEFERLTGIAPDVAERLYHTLPYRRHARKCNCTETKTCSGYPGETFEVCLKCNEIVNSHMNWGAIE